jgi:hypothetical protein
MRDNAPRHLAVLQKHLLEGQRQGTIRPLPIPQLVGTCAGALALPIIVGGAIAQSAELEPKAAKMIATTLLSDAAIDQRIELVLAAISQPASAAAAAPRAKAPRGKSRGRP